MNESAAPRKYRQVTLAILPSLITLGNLVCGCASVFFAMNAPAGFPAPGQPSALSIAAWLIFAGMVFDMLDGQVARLTKTASEFGGELDSLCDAITFGFAPAALVYRTVPQIERHLVEHDALGVLPTTDLGTAGGRVLWALCLYYTVCAVLRLARFNVANEPGEDSHQDFRGLPSPAAAGVIAGLVLLLYGFEDGRILKELIREEAFAAALYLGVPLVTFAVGTLMVSRVRYLHVMSWFVRGRRPPAHLVFLLLLLVVFAVFPQPMLAGCFLLYALAGPFLTFRGWVLQRRAALDPDDSMF